MEGFADGTLVGGDGAERELIRRVTDLRAEYFSIGDLSAGRMPIAYVQLLQILVDTLVWLAPFSLYPGLGVLSIPLCAILTHFFKGLLELSKSFLDPFGNDGYPNQNIRCVLSLVILVWTLTQQATVQSYILTIVLLDSVTRQS